MRNSDNQTGKAPGAVSPSHCLIVSLSLLLALPAIAAEPSDPGLDLFKGYIEPLFQKRCYECHSHEAKKAKGGLVLDSREGWVKGGDSGTAVKPGDAEASLLLKALLYHDPDLQMPPKKQLSELEIGRVREWIALGAPDPRKSAMADSVAKAAVKGKDLWSTKPLKQTPVPMPENAQWVVTDIDRFVLSSLEKAGLEPSPDTDPATWLRRVHLMLTGLLPEPAEVEAFVRACAGGGGDNETIRQSDREKNSAASVSPSPHPIVSLSSPSARKAMEAKVDSLLASRHFGERWGRHWLDVARYTDVMSSLGGKPFREAWRYRDYVIDAYNSDKPFDVFIREQLAGDLIPAATPEKKAEQLVATGFLSIGHWPGEASEAGDPDLTLMEIANEQISTVSTAFLSLTVGCAKCHDHKFDPIPTADYYAMAGIFRSSWAVTFNYPGNGGGARYVGANNVLLPPTKDPRSFISAPGTVWRDLEEEEKAAKSQAKNKNKEPKKNPNLRPDGIQLHNNGSMFAALPDAPPLAVGAREADSVMDVEVRIRGEVGNKGPVVQRGFLSCLPTDSAKPPKDQSGRVQLAEWLLDEKNPLTPRVAVNRLWHHLFGTGLVRTVDDFGITGEAPSHPELLDYLAQRFRTTQGWSQKQFIREVLLSRVFRQSGHYVAKSFEVDAANRLLWRMSPRRMEAEVLADTLGQLRGTLDLKPATYTVPPYKSEDQGDGTTMLDIPVETLNKRAVYWPVFRRDQPVDLDVLAIYDYPDTRRAVGERDVSTLPTQSLYLINSDFVRKTADSLASRITKRGEVESLRELCLRIYGRLPTAAESQTLLAAVKQARSPAEGWREVSHALLMSSEFSVIH